MLSELTLKNFRSYRDRTVILSSAITVIGGENGTGKTNIVEALHCLILTKSFRVRDTALIHDTADYFRITGAFFDREVALSYGLVNNHLTKQVFYDGVKTTLGSHIGNYRVVLFEPNDLNIAYGGPDGRRKYLDRILEQLDPSYSRTLYRYRRVLAQRASLLQQRATASDLFAWNIKLSEYGTAVSSMRGQLVDDLARGFGAIYSEIAGENINAGVEYITNTPPASEYLYTLEQNYQLDSSSGTTGIGPHRDDVRFTMRSSDLVLSASRGEVRSFILTLKKQELAALQQNNTHPPLLLLDDVFSELDAGRRKQLVLLTANHQTIITTTDPGVLQDSGLTDYQEVFTNGKD